MARETYVLRNGELVPKSEAAPLGGPSGPFVISDTMTAVRSMVDGKLYDSKSVYYRSVKAAGCEVIGNDSVPRRRTEMPPVRDDIRRAIQQHGG